MRVRLVGAQMMVAHHAAEPEVAKGLAVVRGGAAGDVEGGEEVVDQPDDRLGLRAGVRGGGFGRLVNALRPAEDLSADATPK